MVEAAVMLEAGWQDAMDEVWVVAVEPDLARYVGCYVCVSTDVCVSCGLGLGGDGWWW